MKKLPLVIGLLMPLAAFADESSSAMQKLFNSMTNGCWACGAFNVISAIGLSFADNVFQTLADSLKLILGLFIGLWVLYFAAKVMLPFGPDGGRGQWNEFAKKMFRTVVVLALLEGSGPFWDYVFIPLISSGMDVASIMASASDKFDSVATSGSDAGSGGSESEPNGTVDYCHGDQALPNGITGMSDSAQQSAKAMMKMDCPLSKIQSQFAKGIFIGAATMTKGSCDAKTLGAKISEIVTFGLSPLMAAIDSFFSGLGLVIVFTFGYLVFPFLLIDVIMRVSLVAATSPLLIAASLFHSTAKLAEKGLWALVHCSLTLVFGSAVPGSANRRSNMSSQIYRLPRERRRLRIGAA
jgi:hypothetical protein